MKTKINNTLQIIGFILIAFLFYSVRSGQFIHVIIGLFGFGLMMTGLLKEVNNER